MSERDPTTIPGLPEQLLDSLNQDSHWLLTGFPESISLLNSLIHERVPTPYSWRYWDDETYEKKRSALIDRLPPADALAAGNALLYAHHARLTEAYSMMCTWRIAEVARSGIHAIRRDEWVSAALLARAALESTAQYVDFARLLKPNLDRMTISDFHSELIGLGTVEGNELNLEEYIVKTVFGSRLPDDPNHLKPTNIGTVIRRVAKSPFQNEILGIYNELCEVTHPNFLGRSMYLQESKLVGDAGDQIISIGPGAGPTARRVQRATVLALAWAVGNHVTMFPVLQDSVAQLLSRLQREYPSDTGEKPGRNAPCPCGSGKKFKRCCARHK